MACYEAGTIIELDAREAVTLSDVRGSTLRVTRGTLWLTQENDTHDVILRAGDNWVVEKQGARFVTLRISPRVERARRAAPRRTLSPHHRMGNWRPMWAIP